MKKKIVVRTFSFFFAVLLCFMSLTICASARSVIPKSIQTSDIVDDLLVMERYNSQRYDVDETVDYCEIVDFIEWGYDYNGSTSDYGLYLYIYNPSIKPIDSYNSRNKIQLRFAPIDENVSGGDVSWEKFGLIYCDSTSDNLFYKFKVDVSSAYMLKPDKTMRIYQIADVEFKYSGEDNARSVGCSGQWMYTGYQEYHGANKNDSKSTLYWDSTSLVTLDLELNAASWKTKTSDKGSNYQYEISSVYFSVPDKIIRDYGNRSDPYKGLREVNGYYENYKVRGVSANDQTTYNIIKKYEMVDCNKKEVPFAFVTSPYKDSIDSFGGAGLAVFYSEFGYNDIKEYYSSYESFDIKYSLNTYGNAFYDIVGSSSQEFESAILEKQENNNLYVQYGSLHAENGNYYSVKVDKNTNLGKQMSSMSVANGKYNMWDFDHGVPKYEEEGVYTGIEPLIYVNPVDIAKYKNEVLSDMYFICNEDIGSFVDYSATETLKGKHTFLMRFAVTDYYVCDIDFGFDKDYHAIPYDGYYFEKEIFLDFDILSMTWENKNGIRTVLPVKASPINVVGSVTPPPSYIPETEAVENVASTGCQKLMDLRTGVLVVGVILIVLAFCLIPGALKLLGMGVSGLWFLLTLPVRGIVWVFEKVILPDRNRKKEHQEKGKEEAYGREYERKQEQKAIKKAERQKSVLNAKKNEKSKKVEEKKRNAHRFNTTNFDRMERREKAKKLKEFYSHDEHLKHLYIRMYRLERKGKRRLERENKEE